MGGNKGTRVLGVLEGALKITHQSYLSRQH